MAGKKDEVKKEETKEVATQGTTAMATFDYGEYAAPVGAGVAAGFEGQTNEDTQVPFMSLLQDISPAVKKIDGAEPGMWMNTVTKDLFSNPKGFQFVIGLTRHEYVQFRPRKMGGGFVNRYDIDDPIVAKSKAASKSFGEYYVDSDDGRTGDKGDELTETFYCFGCLADGDGNVLGMACIAFKSTGIKAYKSLMTQLRAHTIPGPGGKKVVPPLFAHCVRVTSEGTKNAEGEFFKPILAPAVGGSVAKSMLPPDDERFLMALACKNAIEGGAVKVDYNKSQGDGTGPAAKDEDVPF